MKINIKILSIISLITISCSFASAENTECSGTAKTAAQGTFALGYNYSFTTSANGTDVTFICELLDTDKSGLIAYAWTYNPNFAEVAMTLVSGRKYSKTFTGQLGGSTFKVACKFAYAGGMAVTQTFTYTVGSNCGVIPGAPTLTTTALTGLTSTSAISGGNISVAGTSAVTARGVCWSTDPAPTVDMLTKTVDGTGIGSFTSNIVGLTPGIKYYVRAYATNNAGTNYGQEISFVAPDTEIPTGFIATTDILMSTSIRLLLKAFDNSGKITYVITYGSTVINVQESSGTEVGYTIGNLLPGTNYSFSIIAKDATGNIAANAPLILTATTKPGVNSAPVPIVESANVVSIFSDTYNSIPGTLFNPMGEQSTVVSTMQISNNQMLKFADFDFQEIELGNNLNLTALGMTNLHFDAWTEDETALNISLINKTPESLSTYTLPVVRKEVWNTYNVAISEFLTKTGFSVNSVYKLKFEGSGNSGSELKIVYFDNIYFWTQPTALSPIYTDKSVICFPNPAKDWITIKAEVEINKLVVRNLVGQEVKTLTIHENEKTIDVSDVRAGNYVVSVLLQNGYCTSLKLIKL